ncbi:MAG: hypothetical protein HPY53_11190 [Brevinematales bacterium]|nr:hypothetical protein [Brevinematales bacterium]
MMEREAKKEFKPVASFLWTGNIEFIRDCYKRACENCCRKPDLKMDGYLKKFGFAVEKISDDKGINSHFKYYLYSHGSDHGVYRLKLRENWKSIIEYIQGGQVKDLFSASAFENGNEQEIPVDCVLDKVRSCFNPDRNNHVLNLHDVIEASQFDRETGRVNTPFSFFKDILGACL